jgi:translation elongation factor P/translation initiation factor 5A
MILFHNRFSRLLISFGRPDSVRTVKLRLLILLLALVALPVVAEDWTTTDGTKYQNVRVIRVEDDAVTIIYKDGGALVFLYKLPAGLQQKFDYDPVKAKIAAEKRSKEDAENAAELQKEIEQADVVKHNQQVQIANQLSGTGTKTP